MRSLPAVIRWHEPALAEMDEWRREQPDLTARGEAIRRLVEAGLQKGKKRSPKLPSAGKFSRGCITPRSPRPRPARC